MDTSARRSQYRRAASISAWGRNSSWAVRWLVSAYLADMYCLYPNIPLDLNNGLDGSGTHCGAQKKSRRKLASQPVAVNSQPVRESVEGYRAYCDYLRLNGASGFLARVRRKLFGWVRKY